VKLLKFYLEKELKMEKLKKRKRIGIEDYA